MDTVPIARPRDTDPPPLLGRDRELAAFDDTLTDTFSDRGRTVLLSGEAGIGKSTLVAHVRHDAERKGAIVLTGHCYDLTATPPYGPWIGVIQSYDRLRSDTDAELPEIPPELMPGTPLVTIQMQGQLFDSVYSFLDRVAHARPLVIILEDLHWADPASIEMLRDLARRLNGAERARLLLIATFRENELDIEHPLYQHRPALVRESNALRINLQRLDSAALDGIVRSRYGLSDDDRQRLGVWLDRQSEGNPFFALELLRSLEATGVLARDATGWRLGDPAATRTPDLIRQVVTTRLAHLDEPSRRSLQVAAVIGEEVPFDLWMRVDEQTEDAMIDAYERSERLQILAESASGQGFRFTHALIRQALYESIASPRRRLWHRQIGEVLENMPSVAPDTIAWHYQQAGDERAIAWLVRAGNRAQMAYAWRTAIERLQAAEEILQGYPHRQIERGWLLFRLGSMYRFSDVPTARRYFDAAFEVASASGDTALTAFTTYARATARINSGDVRGGLPMLERAIDLLMTMPEADRTRLNNTPGLFSPRAVPDVETIHQVSAAASLDKTQPPSVRPAMTVGDIDRYGVLAMLLAETGQAQRALDIVTHGLEHLPDDHLADRRFSGRLHRAGGLALGLIGEIARAKESHLLSCRIFDSAGLHLETFQSILACLETVIDVYHLDDVDQRARLLLQAREYGELAEAAFPSNLTYQHLLLRDLLLDGVWDDVASLVATEGIESGQFLIVHDIHAAAGWLAWRRGDTTEAWRRVRALIPRGPATEPGDAVFLAALDLQRVAIGLSLDGGQLKDARSWLASLERWVAWSGTVVGRAEARIEAARIHLASGDLHTARELASEALALAESPGRQLPLIEARRVAGVIAVAMLRFGEAREHLTASATLAARCNVPFERALTALELARLSLATGDVLSARSHLETAREIANRLGARPQLEHVSRIEDEITDASGRSAYPAGLSQREVEVLRLIASGMTDAEAAEALSISPRTVGQHLRSIYNKLGVSSRVAASRFAVENGLV